MDKLEASSRRGRPLFTNNGNSVERRAFRSLVCDESGIIIGEMVYRCLICSYVNESMDMVRNHYQSEHVEIDDSLNGEYRYLNMNGDYCPSPANSYMEDSGPSGHNADDNEQEDGGRSAGFNGGSYGGGPKSRSGYITCQICSSTRFYSYVQRRYGQYSCSACYRHFREFLLKPKTFSCPTLASCPLDAKNKCRACWLLACINVYDGNIDDEKQKILEKYRPVKALPEEEDDVDDEDREMDPVDGDGIIEKECEDYDQVKDDESESEMTSIKAHSSLLDEQDEQGTISGEEQSVMPASNAGVKRTLNKKVHNIFKKVNKRKRNWSCMKCANCLKQECGKCVYCLDRPKYGGQFRLRQRCAVRRCLLKLKDT